MNTIQETRSLDLLQHVIHIPDGATVLEVSTFFTSFSAPDDTYTERLNIKVCGVEFCILRYDGRNKSIYVYTGNSMAMMPLDQVDEYIRKRTR